MIGEQMRKDAGRRARDEALMLDRLVECMRLASFRNYLGATVHSMSAIVPDVLATVPDVLATAGSDVTSALQRIRPGHLWPMSTAPKATTSKMAQASRRGYPIRTIGDARATTYRSPSRAGDAVIADGAPGEWVEVAIVGDSLEVVLRSDGSELSTHAGFAHLRLAGSLPDTVLAACEGRPLDDVVDHPLLRGRGYVVARSSKLASASTLQFEVGRVALEMPWRA